MKELKNVPIQIVTNNKDFLKVSEICNKYNLLSPVIGGMKDIKALTMVLNQSNISIQNTC